MLYLFPGSVSPYSEWIAHVRAPPQAMTWVNSLVALGKMNCLNIQSCTSNVRIHVNRCNNHNNRHGMDSGVVSMAANLEWMAAVKRKNYANIHMSTVFCIMVVIVQYCHCECPPRHKSPFIPMVASNIIGEKSVTTVCLLDCPGEATRPWHDCLSYENPQKRRTTYRRNFPPKRPKRFTKRKSLCERPACSAHLWLRGILCCRREWTDQAQDVVVASISISMHGGGPRELCVVLHLRG